MDADTNASEPAIGFRQSDGATPPRNPPPSDGLVAGDPSLSARDESGPDVIDPTVREITEFVNKYGDFYLNFGIMPTAYIHKAIRSAMRNMHKMIESHGK